MTEKPDFDFDHWKKWLDQSHYDGIKFGPYAAVIHYLQNGAHDRLPGGNRLIQCMIRPMGGAWASYEVFQTDNRHWLLKTNVHHFPKLGLTFEISEVSEADIKSLMALTDQKVMIFEAGAAGLDGIFYDLVLSGDGFQRVHYSWWSETSGGWKPIMSLLNAFVTHLENILEGKNT